MRITNYFYLALLSISTAAFAQSFPALETAKLGNTPKFSIEISEQLKNVLGRPSEMQRKTQALMGTASHGFAATFDCVPKDQQVESFEQSRELAAFIVAYEGSNKELEGAVGENEREWLSLLSELVAQDILGTPHVWTATEAQAQPFSTESEPLSPLLLSAVSYGKRADPLLRGKCLTYTEMVRTLIYASLQHQKSWLPESITDDDLQYLAELYVSLVSAR